MRAIVRSAQWFVLSLMLAAPAHAQDALEIIPLRHRTVDQVLPVLRPLLEPGGTMSGQANQLFVRTSPRNLADIRRALEAIDAPARRLVISVRFDSAGDAARSGVEAGGRISNRGDSRVDVRVQDSRSSGSERVDQRMQVLEGSQATIATGESRHGFTHSAEAATGFVVVPRLSGSMVFLDIATQKEAFARGGAIQGQRAVTTVSGRLGEWIELGGVDSASSRSGGGIASSRESSRSESRRTWVKVEEAR